MNRLNEEMEFIKVGDFEMNLTYPCFRKGGKRIFLTPKEFELMHYFMKNPNRILKEENILISVWGWTAEIQTRVISGVVRRIRKKIGEGYIKNYPCWGYKFIP